MFDYPNKLDIIFDKLYEFNIKPIIVGGYVRDYFLHLDSKDIDIELYGLDSLDTLENILREFGDLNSVGKSFGVCKLSFNDLEIDFSLPREDSKVSSGHKGFNVKTNKNLDFKSAASRRDFTINAMGYNVKEKKLLDPYAGQKDLQNKILRAVDMDKFAQDPLRVLRAIQFSSRLHFTLDKKLFRLIQTLIQNKIIKELPRERIYEELKKMFLKSSSPSLGLVLLHKLHLLVYFGFTQVYKQVDYFAQHKTLDKKLNMLIFLSLLYTYETLKLIETLSNESKLLSNITLFLKLQKEFDINDNSSYNLYSLSKQVNIENFLLYLDAYHSGKKNSELNTLRKNAQKLNVYNAKLPALIQGRNLIEAGLLPSKKFSVLLSKGYEAQMRGEFKTLKESQKWLQNYLVSLS